MHHFPVRTFERGDLSNNNWRLGNISNSLNLFPENYSSFVTFYSAEWGHPNTVQSCFEVNEWLIPIWIVGRGGGQWVERLAVTRNTNSSISAPRRDSNRWLFELRPQATRFSDSDHQHRQFAYCGGRLSQKTPHVLVLFKTKGDTICKHCISPRRSPFGAVANNSACLVFLKNLAVT